MNKFEEFEEAGKELDDLTAEGYYGDDVKKLTASREEMDLNEYLYQSVKLWIDDKNLYGKDQVKEFISLFLDLYASALKVRTQEVIDVLAVFWKGTSENPGSEALSAYGEFSRIFTEVKNKIKNVKGREMQLHEKKSFAADLINTYSKGVEMVGKILNPCLALAEISNNNRYDLFNISKLTIYKKTEKFNSLSNNKYTKITSFINRYIRNSDAHLSITFKPELNKFAYKRTVKGKTETEFISIEEVIFKLLPSVGWVVQAFIYSSILLIFYFNDKQKYHQLALEIENA
ncbi:hypothetical protein ACWH4V_13265 [Bacillus mojavensis]